jgi:hypothetical protein
VIEAMGGEYETDGEQTCDRCTARA